MKEERIEKKERILSRAFAGFTASLIYLMNAGACFADVFDSAKKSLETITKGLEVIVCPLGTCMAIIALIVYFVASDPQTAQRGKNWAIRIFIAVALIFASSNIIDYMSSVFNG